MPGVICHPRRKDAPSRAVTIYNWIIAFGFLGILVLVMYIDNERRQAERKQATNPAVTVTAK